VVLGVTPEALDHTIAATETFALGGALGTSFTARVSGLAPRTTHYYRVGADGADHPPAGTDPFSFHTLSADPCASFRVTVIGDNRADLDGRGPNAIWDDILGEAMMMRPDLLVNTGDMVKNGDNPEEWSNFIDASEAGFALVPSILTMGNHDEDDANGDVALYNQLFELPRNSETGTEDYYSIDAGPVHFVSLNTQFTRPDTELDPMVAWLESDLSATAQPWIVVFFHKAIYSRGNHSTGEEDDGAINRALVPVFDAHDVDLVFDASRPEGQFAPLRHNFYCRGLALEFRLADFDFRF
jgi:hypothetical protein